MARSLKKAKGRRESSTFSPFPHDVFQSDEYAALSALGVKLLFDLFMQYRIAKDGAGNNGDFTTAWTVMHKRGWTSKRLLYRAIDELRDKGWIVQTRKGGKNLCALYAVTWKPIDPCGGKLDILPTRVPSHAWKIKTLAHQVERCGPPCGPIQEATNAN